MKRTILILSILALVVGCVGIPPDLIDTSVENITLRHDAYIAADATLTPTERDAYLQEAALLRGVIEEAKK
jgi:hypothetical protein